MLVDQIRTELMRLPQVASWEQMRELVHRPTDDRSMACWDYTVRACRAVGGTQEQAVPGAAAIFCMMYSIHLVDDMLDEDPRGLYHDVGAGTVANLAVAFQAAGQVLLEEAGIPSEVRVTVQDDLARTALATAYGQHLDLSGLEGEEEYWRIVENKAPPLFGSALYLGAVLGGAAVETARGIQRLGSVLGKSTQVSDDLMDALEEPARPDWQSRWNNLPILYAMTAEHPDRGRFLELVSEVEDPEALAEAQEILVRSGAVSFCTYQLVELQRDARRQLERLTLPDSGPIEELLEHHSRPLRSLLRRIGVESPEALLA